MQNQTFISAIAEVKSDSLPTGRSRLAIFLDGDKNNLSDDNVIEEGYFDNCYSYDMFLEDLVLKDRLLKQRDAFEANLQKMKTIIERLQRDLDAQ